MYNNVKEFICDLLENEGEIFCDNYGRQWIYKDYKFYFKDIGLKDVFEEKLSCLHLFGTQITKER